MLGFGVTLGLVCLLALGLLILYHPFWKAPRQRPQRAEAVFYILLSLSGTLGGYLFLGMPGLRDFPAAKVRRQIQETQAHLVDSLKQDPTKIQNWLFLARTQLLLKDQQGARQTLQMLHKILKDPAQKKKIRRMIEAIEKDNPF